MAPAFATAAGESPYLSLAVVESARFRVFHGGDLLPAAPVPASLSFSH
jgi:hypothetical protein